MTDNAFNFSTAPDTFPVVIDDEPHELVEASEDAVREYRNSVLKGMVVGPNGQPQRMTGMGDLDSMLISRCLRKVGGNFVNINKVRGWPRRVTKPLAAKIKEMSGIDEEEKGDEEGNLESGSQTDTTIGSESQTTTE